MRYDFDRHLRAAELGSWLREVATRHPDLVEVESIGRSHEGRDLWLVTVTDSATGPHDAKPAHWVDASIHAVELTATVAACRLIDRLVRGHGSDPTVTQALQTRTFYVMPRVNPDGAEWVLADRPRFRRSSVRPWPWRDGHRWPGLECEDVDGDGRILQMRLADAAGGWMPHPDDARLMVPVPPEGAPTGVPTYRLLTEGTIADYDGFTIDTPRPVEGLDLNRNYPAGWARSVLGSGDHPLSEPEVEALVRAIVARPNVCSMNAYHTNGGVLLRPSSSQPDAELSPYDVWTWKQLGERGTALTGYPAHSAFEDFTWDPREPMSGASDDWAFEHLGVFGWTVEFWDVVHVATGQRSSTHMWYTGPTDAESLAVLRWCDEHHPDGYVDWRPFEHPQLGAIEIGGWDDLNTWVNPPPSHLAAEVEGQADFAVHQALCSPRLEIVTVEVTAVGDGAWRVAAGVANTGWLPTDVSAHARKQQLVLPLTVEVKAVDGAAIELVDGPTRRRFGQLDGRSALRFRSGNDGTPDRVLAAWVVRAEPGTRLQITARHDRAGRASIGCELA